VPHDVLGRERLAFLVWANNLDLRGPEPRWWHGVLATRRTSARANDGDDGDVILPDGRVAWIDGGPRGPVAGVHEPIVHRESIGLGRLTPAGGGRAALTGLADDQRTAVAHGRGPARIIAPAGSGKTRVLTARLRHLRQDRLVEPELVTAVAYNTRAAAEMRDRVDDPSTSIRTIHSLALWICGLDDRREVLDERGVRAILDRLVRTARIPNQDPYQAWLDALAEVRLALRDPEVVEHERGDVDGFAETFVRYRDELVRRRALDFDEQIYRAIELLLTRPDIRRIAQRAGTHLLVDEFQDLTPAFLLLVRLVAGPSMQVFAVGDDDQTIYGYAGATPRYLVDIDRWFPGATHHALEVNYRCPAAVVDAAGKLLSHNRVRIDKRVRAARRDPDPHALHVHRVGAQEMADRTLALVTAPAAGDPRSVAVLARVNSALLPVQVALTEAGVPHTAPLSAGVLERTGIRTALAYLRIGREPDRIRRADVLDTINRPARKVKSAVVPLLRRGALSLESLRGIADRLDGVHHDRFLDYVADLERLATAILAGADTVTLLRLIREDIGLGEAMDALDASRTRPEGSAHVDDLDALAQLAPRHPDPATFAAWLADRLRTPADPDGVTLSTIHRVKGREWDRVIVFAANDGLLPHRLSDDVEEERRVLHVAVTRCRVRVDVVADAARPSPFLAELARAAPPRETISPADASRAPTAPLIGGTTATDSGRGARERASDRRTGGARTPEAAAVSLSAEDRVLLEKLRAWRAETARASRLPAFVVFHDRHLEAIAHRRPRDLRELARCPGVGPAKLERYGDDLLDLVDRAG
jgi:DNA helicase II / ATP-dependent DNA helicase PcrA